MRPAAVLLDAGNTLVEPDFEVIAGIFREAGCEMEAARAREALARSLPAFSAYAAAGHSTAEVGALVFFFDRFFERLGIADPAVKMHVGKALGDGRFAKLWYSPLDGAREAVVELRDRGYRLAVVSNSDGEVAEKLERGGFGGLFETIVDSAVVGVEKPDPRIFLIALERMGLPPGQAVYVGDIPAVDVEGARAAGVAPVLIDAWDGFPDVDVPRIATLPDLVPLLEAGIPDASGNPG